MDAILLVPKRRLLVAIALALASSGLTAATIAVDSNDDSKAHKGCNLREAITSINNAAAIAKCSATMTGTFGDGDTIVFAPSLVDSVITLARGELTITKTMTIIGSGQTIDADGKSTVFDVNYGSLTASDLIVQNGYSTYGAGGISAGTLTLNRVTLAHNRGWQGGAIEAGTANVTDSYIHDNYAISGGAIAGGALTVSGTSISDNTALTDAGAILVRGTLAVTDSVLSGNRAAGGAGGGRGGAISVNYGNLAITDCVLAGNMAAVGGGAIWARFNASTALITGSTISGNSAGDGGAINNYNGSFAITNSTLAYNTATYAGGAISGFKYSAIVLTNVTVSGNTAASGGAIWNEGPGGAPIHLFNSIVSANSAANSPEIGGKFTLTGNNNLFGTTLDVPPFNDAANNNLFTDAPGLGPLQDNGGFTDTMALLAGSPAIDAGSNVLASGLTTDQRGAGFPRVLNGTVDIGAFEQGDQIFSDGFESGP